MPLSPINHPVPGRDQGVFLYIGQQITVGRIPYLDAWDHKGPLLFYINALGLLLEPGGLWGVWWLEVVWVMVGLLTLFFILRSYLPSIAALFGVFTWLAGFSIVMAGNVVEEYSFVFNVLIFYLVLKQSRFSLFLIGICGGLSFMLRPNEISALLTAMIFLADKRRISGWKELPSDYFQIGIGFALVNLLVFLYFGVHGAIGALVSSVFDFNFLYIQGERNVLNNIWMGVTRLVVPIGMSLFFYLFSLLKKGSEQSEGQRRILSLGTSLLIVTIPFSILSGKPYGHYYIAWLLPLSVISSFGFQAMGETLFGTRTRLYLRTAAWTIAIACLLVGVEKSISSPAEIDRGQRIVALVRNMVPDGDRLFIWGNQTNYAFMAKRELLDRYIYLTPIMTPVYGEPLAANLLEDIKKYHPVIVDVSPTDAGIPSLASTKPTYAYLNDLYEYIHQNYQPVEIVAENNWVVWRFKEKKAKSGY